MAGVRFPEVQARPTAFLDFTRLTREAFQVLLPPFAAAFQAQMAAWRLDGTPRTARPFAVYKHCPLPTPADRLFCLLTYLKTYALQVVQGRLCGMGQSNAHPWIHVLLPALPAALRTRGAPPARALTALAQRLGISESAAAPAAAPACPLLPMTAPNGASSAAKMLRNSRTVRAARNRRTRGNMACWSMPPAPSSSGVRATAAVSMRSASPRRRRRPCPLGVGWDRLWAAWPSRCPTWTASCRRRNRVAKSGRGNSTWPTRPWISAGGGLSMSTAV